MTLLEKLKSYKKTIAAVVIGAVGWVTLVTQSVPDNITSSEWIAGATMLLTAVGVFAWRNDATNPTKKTIAALAVGGIGWVTMVCNSAPSGITTPELIAGMTTLLTALGVYAWQNEPAPADVPVVNAPEGMPPPVA